MFKLAEKGRSAPAFQVLFKFSLVFINTTASSKVVNHASTVNVFSCKNSVRVKGGMSLWNGMWHGLRNDIIMRNLIYADHFQRSKLN